VNKLLNGFIILIVFLVAGTALFLATLDANEYRTQLADALSKQTGRTIKLSGPIKLGFSWHGVSFGVQDAGVSNPFWAGRPMMAGIGRFDLGISLLPLLYRKLVITRLEIVNADIDLETDRDGRHNWDFSSIEQQNTTATWNENAKTRSVPVSLQVRLISVNDSHVTFHDMNGKASVFKVAHMTLGVDDTGVAMHFNGEYDGAPLTLNINTGARDFLSAKGSWPFDANLAYANYRL
jgi:uncharacterized protein involved in outer membrane biogenesis